MKTLLKRLTIVGSAVWFALNLSAQTTLPSPPPERNGQHTVSAGKAHSLAIGEGNVLWAWGSNATGQLGVNSTTESFLAPNQVVGGGVWAIASAGEDHSLAVRQDGSLWAWGNNDEGQLGDGTLTLRRSPVRVGNEVGWVAISAGAKFSLALKADGRLYAWGKNNDGQVGFRSTTDPKRQLTPRLVLNANGTTPLFSGIAAGSGFSLALGPRGTGGTASLFAWGANAVNQLGLGTPGQLDASGNVLDADPSQTGVQLPLNVYNPLRVGTSSSWTAIAAGELHGLVLDSSGSVHSWGLSVLGSLGRATTATYPGVVSGISNATHISAGGNHSLALSAGQLYGWGSNADGQLGIPLTNEFGTFLVNNLSRATPTLLSPVTVDRISAGSAHTLAFGPTSSYGFGKNTSGQLGNATNLSPNGFDLSVVKFGLPDLAVTNVTILNSDVSKLLPGDTLSLRVTVKNNGTTGVDAGFTFLQARLSTDESFDLTDSLLTPVAAPVSFTSRIAGGGEAVQDFAFVIPGSLGSDVYRVALRVDDNSTVLESDESNNDFAGPAVLRFLPNLTVLPQPTAGTWKLTAGAVTTPALSRSILAGDLAVALNTLNGGTGPFGSLVSVTTLGAGHFLVRFSTPGDQPLLAGDFTTLTPAVGQVRVVTEGTLADREEQEIFLSDLPLQLLSSSTVSRGSSFSANLTVSNSGATPFAAASVDTPVKVRLFLTLDSTLGNTDDIEMAVFDLTTDIAALGGSVVLPTGNLTVPRYLNTGLYRFGVSVDSGTKLEESNEGDNLVYLPSVFLNVVADASTVSLQSALDITFKNEAGAVIPAPAFTFAESGTGRWFGEVDPASVGGNRALVPPLSAGDTATFSITLNGPFKISFNWGIQSLSDVLSFTVDGVAPTRTNTQSVLTGQKELTTFEATVGSSNLPRILTWTYRRTGANPAEVVLAQMDGITITPLTTPDLLISQLSFNAKNHTTFVLQDLATPLDVVILGGNFGAPMAGGSNGGSSFDAEVRLSKDKVWGNADDVVLGKLEPVQALDSSNRFVYSQVFDLINCIPEGPYYVAVKVDSGSAYGEFDETNNIQFSSTASVNIEARPNLQVESRVVKYRPGLYTRRQHFPVEFNLINSGCKDISPGETVRYNVTMVGATVSNDATGSLKITYLPALDRLFLAAEDSGGLKAGSKIRIVQNFRIPDYMESNVIENFSGYKPAKDEIFEKFCDFTITSEESSSSAINEVYFGSYVAQDNLFYPESSLFPGEVKDLPKFGVRGPVLFGVKVGLSASIPIVRSEVLFTRLGVGVVATRPESVSYDYFRRFWSMRWNQMDQDGVPLAVAAAQPAFPLTFPTAPAVNPFGFDVGAAAADPDGDGFDNETEFRFGSNPWVGNFTTGQLAPVAPVKIGLIETGGITDSQGQVILEPTKYLSATFNVLMQHAFGSLSDTEPRNSSEFVGLIGKAPTDAYVSHAKLRYVVEASSFANFPAGPSTETLFTIQPKTTLNQIEGDVGTPLRLLPHTFDPNVVGVTTNGSTIRLTILDKTSVDGFTSRFMRVRVEAVP